MHDTSRLYTHGAVRCDDDDDDDDDDEDDDVLCTMWHCTLCVMLHRIALRTLF